jgi:hypothetical protein
MALKKAIVLVNGFTAEYWRIGCLNTSISNKSILLEGFKDKASRDAKMAPVDRKIFKSGSLLTIADAYTFIKTQAAFADSEDI